MGNAPILGVLAGVESRAITVVQSRCAKVRNRNVACLKCADACTTGCIALVDDELVVDSTKCVGCGTCATVCPTCALESRNPTDAELLAACRACTAGDAATIACSQLAAALADKADPAKFAEVVCLGRVDESLLVALAADGVKNLRLACGDCTACEQRHGRDTACLVAETAATLLAAWGSDASVEVVDGACEGILAEGVSLDEARAACESYFSTPRACERIGAGADDAAHGEEPRDEAPGDVSQSGAPGDDVPDGGAAQDEAPDGEEPQGAGRDELPAFAFAGHQRADELQPGLLRVMKDGTLPHFLPDRRDRLLGALARLGTPAAGSIATRLWGCVVIDGGKCSSCRMCATFCPTGAISKFDDADGTFGVLHLPGDCVKCGSCRDICPEDAISLLDDVEAPYLMDGAVHRYIMKPREVEIGQPHQILDTMRTVLHDAPNLYER